MKKQIIVSVYVLASMLFSTALSAQTPDIVNQLIGGAYTGAKGYEVLQKICDQAGGRPMGSAANEKAMGILIDELKAIGMSPEKETFTATCWERGDDFVEMTSPVLHRLKANALGYCNPAGPFEADVVSAGAGTEEDFAKVNVKDKVVLIYKEKLWDSKAPNNMEILSRVKKGGGKAVLLYMNNPGQLAIAKTVNYQGDPEAMPYFSLSYEDGKWLQRLLDAGETPKVKLAVKSKCIEKETANIVQRFPGKSNAKIVLSAHFDSWDLGTGAVDNGQGTALLFEIARLVKTYCPSNYYTIECVWLNGEELGLVGAWKYVEKHKSDSIICNINMDMTGTPEGFNMMGFDEYIPFFEKIVTDLSGFDLYKGVSSQMWTNSDHVPFMLEGIPVFSISAKLEESMYKFYHESGDTFDKVSKRYISDAAAVVSVVVYRLATDTQIVHRRHTANEMMEQLKKHNLEEKLRRQGEWKYGK
ncbi:MAG: M28 family peptidase [Bacteroidetes bacterium]|nr:M28 family peptidase [Bacteroidota bacterium]